MEVVGLDTQRAVKAGGTLDGPVTVTRNVTTVTPDSNWPQSPLQVDVRAHRDPDADLVQAAVSAQGEEASSSSSRRGSGGGAEKVALQAQEALQGVMEAPIPVPRHVPSLSSSLVPQAESVRSSTAGPAMHSLLSGRAQLARPAMAQI